MTRRNLAAVLIVALSLAWTAATAASQAFQHPGVLVSRAQLDFMRQQVAAHNEPFWSEYQKAVASPYGALHYELKGPPANGIIDCGSHSHPDNGCHAEDDDASAAYLQSLLWYISGDHRYADNAIRIVNAYAHHLTAYTNTNSPLQAAWSAEMFPRAGEILRYSNAGWNPEDVAAFSHMLTVAILPLIRNGSGANGNWELSMIEGMMGIAVFTDDRPLLEHAEAMWRQRIPAYFYDYSLDGAHPRTMPRKDAKVNWYGTTDLTPTETGMAQETCRDLNHTSYGISATMAAAETAHIQGDKLFEAEHARLAAALEFHAHLLLQEDPVPQRVCGGTVHYAKAYTFVIGYNGLHNRLGMELPYTRKWVEQGVLPADLPVDPHTTVFEPLTHGADAGRATTTSH